MIINSPLNLVFAFLLVSIRLVAFFSVAPPFAGRTVPSRVKAGLAMAMALPLTGTAMEKTPPPQGPEFLMAVAFQILVGASMGFVVLALFAAIQAAGELVDLFSMFTMASLLDPFSNTQSSMFGRINQLVATTLLFVTGGHLVMVRGLVTSFQLVPTHTPDFGGVASAMTNNVARMAVAAVEISGPIVLVLFLTDVAMGLVSRAVPSLNVFQLSFPVKTLLTVSVAAVGVALLPAAVTATTDRVIHEMGPVIRYLGG